MSWYRDLFLAALLVAVLVFYGWALYATEIPEVGSSGWTNVRPPDVLTFQESLFLLFQTRRDFP